MSSSGRHEGAGAREMLGDLYVTPLSCNPELRTNWKTRPRQIEIKKEKKIRFLSDQAHREWDFWICSLWHVHPDLDMSTHPVVGRTPGLPERTGHCEMAAVTGVFSLWPGWSRPKKGTRRDWPTLLSYFSQTHQSNLSLSCRGMRRSHSIFPLVIFFIWKYEAKRNKIPCYHEHQHLTWPWEELLMTWSC